MNESAPVQEKEPGVRRVGTFTMGLVLVVSGVFMLISMFFPELDLRWVLQAAPLALVSLGVETLLASRRRCRIKYDWVGMLLCVLIVCTALALYTAAWCFVHYPDHFYCF
ncbi:hypothetical protein H8790_01470 [Oscillibacter hominis]|uniref:DUF5668 domain-containing protein n=1 Tax=Oscillibacter hominis TaxID=2763056 RepID=A0A7G9B5C0_9FIRM|nr:hypothetical protein [Oscillibacter hominis]QNL44751.1 hypothetical protein H8790_01470 [Oscillibacter hominis]